MLVSGAVGGLMLAMIGGASIMMDRMLSQSYRPVDPRMAFAPQDPSLLGPDPSGNKTFPK